MKILLPPETRTILRTIIDTTGLYSRAVDFEIADRNPDNIDKDLIPEETFAIQYYEIVYTEVELDGDIVPLKSGELKPSPLIYISGSLLDREQLMEDYPEKAATIIPMMNDDDIHYVIKYNGNFKPFRKQDLFWRRADHRDRYLRTL